MTTFLESGLGSQRDFHFSSAACSFGISYIYVLILQYDTNYKFVMWLLAIWIWIQDYELYNLMILLHFLFF